MHPCFIGPDNIDSHYISSTSITHGTPRQHTRSFATYPHYNKPCICFCNQTFLNVPPPPPIVGNTYICVTRTKQEALHGTQTIPCGVGRAARVSYASILLLEMLGIASSLFQHLGIMLGIITVHLYWHNFAAHLSLVAYPDLLHFQEYSTLKLHVEIASSSMLQWNLYGVNSTFALYVILFFLKSFHF